MSCMVNPQNHQESCVQEIKPILTTHLQNPNETLGFSSPNHDPTSSNFFDISDPSYYTVFPQRLTQSRHLSLSLHSSCRLDNAALMIGSDNRNDQAMQLFGQFHEVRYSRFLGPAKELLLEFCNLGIDQIFGKIIEPKKISGVFDDSIQRQSLCGLSLLELHQRKAKLVLMLEEVNTRYNRYCNETNAMVQSFEAVAGSGAAAPYCSMASRAMSRHLRCVKDAILAQIKATNKTIKDHKDNNNIHVQGTTKGETPRLRILDQTMRQKRANFHHVNLMESDTWRRPQRRGLPETAVSVLRAWLFEHFLNPYPSDVDKTILARQTGLSRSQVSNWFINARVRLWKPMVEQMYLEDLKENNNNNNNKAFTDDDDHKPSIEDPTARIESNHIFNNEGKKVGNKIYDGFGAVLDPYGSVQFDFYPYSKAHRPAPAAAAAAAGRQNVSLTLGLRGGGGFAPGAEGSLFSGGDRMEDCETTPYSLLDGESQNLVQYRGFMGANFLNDFVGYK
ncbi:homeobox protein BEL1 homolog [Andrographis paniculata]|uniref:homeobox protein BEL1 homolog n=1 Tax=Andrographis paniculata TaxID=175694 RepID=UPI0021E7EFDD|nr:homeobox protein BEL1 homolog [Andrographis paniculata]